MKNKLILISMMFTVSTVISSCGNKVNSDTIQRNITKFEINSNTIQKHEETTLNLEVDNKNNEIQDNNTYDEYGDIVVNNDGTYEKSLGRLVLQNKDNSKAYEIIDKKHIKYKGITFENLYENIQKIDTEYDKNTLINFIIKTYPDNSDNVYTLVETGLNKSNNDESITIDDELTGIECYDNAKKKFKSTVHWRITIINSKTTQNTQILGCNKYTLITYNGEDLKIDMSQFDSSAN